MGKKSKIPTLKLQVVCGEGVHRMFTASLAELILLNKLGQQPNYFWKSRMVEFVRLIKICGKLAKQFGRGKLAWFIYKEPDYNFDQDIGLIIWHLKGF